MFKRYIILSVFLAFGLTWAAMPLMNVMLQSDLDAGGFSITNAVTPTNSSGLVTRSYVDENFVDATSGSIDATTGTNADIAAALAEKQPADPDLTTWADIAPGTGIGEFLANPSSANLREALTDEVGSGAAVFAGANVLLPSGGSTGQVLSKIDGADYNVTWIDGAGGINWGAIGGVISDQADLQSALDALATTANSAFDIADATSDNVHLFAGDPLAGDYGFSFNPANWLSALGLTSFDAATLSSREMLFVDWETEAASAEVVMPIYQTGTGWSAAALDLNAGHVVLRAGHLFATGLWDIAVDALGLTMNNGALLHGGNIVWDIGGGTFRGDGETLSFDYKEKILWGAWSFDGSGGLDMTGAYLVGLPTPTDPTAAATKSYVDDALENLDAGNLNSGTLPDGRFPATLPAASGVNLTALNGSNVSSGTVPAARLPAASTSAAGIVELATDGETASGVAVQGNDSRLSATRVLNNTADGRLTLTSGLPVTTSDVTAATTIYYTPFIGNSIALYNGTAWVYYSFTERSLSLSGLTSNKNHDVFIYDSSGTLSLEAVAWSSDSARATAIVQQDGVWVKSGSATKRLLGTFRTIATGQTEDSKAFRYVSNAQNQVARPMAVVEAAGSWTYSTAAWRPANANVFNRLGMLACLPTAASANVKIGLVANSTSTVRMAAVGIGVNNTSTSSATVVSYGSANNAATGRLIPSATWVGILPAGQTELNWLEQGAGADTMTWYSGDPTYSSGIYGTINN